MPKNDFEEGNVASIIAEGCHFNGSIKVKGSIRVDGGFEGQLTVSETLVIGKGGKLDAKVETRRASIAGTLKGEINAQDGVKLQSGSHFEGNIFTKNLVIEEGVFFDGGCWRSIESKSRHKSSSPPRKPEQLAKTDRQPTVAT